MRQVTRLQLNWHSDSSHCCFTGVARRGSSWVSDDRPGRAPTNRHKCPGAGVSAQQGLGGALRGGSRDLGENRGENEVLNGGERKAALTRSPIEGELDADFTDLGPNDTGVYRTDLPIIVNT